MNSVRCSKINIEGTSILGEFTVEGDDEWVSLFTKPYMFQIDYDIALNDLPKSIAVIPFVANVLPMVWLKNAVLYVDELDKTFMECLDEVRKGYGKLYPDLVFSGNIEVKKIIENQSSGDGSAVLFSGGVDAFNTLFSHIEEKPSLITLWGADIKRQNTSGWNNVKHSIVETAHTYDLSVQFIKTNFREYLSEAHLTNFVQYFNPHLEWWHDFQHGIAIICHSAPIAYLNGISKVYIASSFTKGMKNYTCASDPLIDDHVRFGNTKVIHDGYEYMRQDKIHNICKYHEKSGIDVPLRVCWLSDQGNNCCHCEKCYRTILGILAEGNDPINYGFADYPAFKKRMFAEIRWKYRINNNYNARYEQIQNRLRETYTKNDCPRELKWFYKVRMKSIDTTDSTVFAKIENLCYRLINKVFFR